MATILVDPRRQIDAIHPNIYGNFIEHLRRCIYGGIYEENSPLSDERGFRQDVLAAIRSLKVPNVRWPGGNFVSAYHWMDGIGPKEERPRKMELAWNTVESNRFGTDEFIEFCRAVGTEPYICVNMGNGTMDEARHWVEYCNGVEDTYYANLRRKNGHDEPYRVKYWALGNEVSGHWKIGHKPAEEYAALAYEYAKVMKLVDQNIELAACGSFEQNASDMKWNQVVVEKLADIADYLAIHMYVGDWYGGYYEYMAASEHIEKFIRAARGIIDVGVYYSESGKKLKIAFDEWNVMYSHDPKHPRHERYTLQDALAVGMFLNAFLRHADAIKLANMAQLVNVIAPIHTNTEGLFLQTIFWPLQLHTLENGRIALDTHWESDCFETEAHGKVPYLDVSASYQPDLGRMSINLINKHRTDALPVTIENQHGSLKRDGILFEITGEDPIVTNDFGEENVKLDKCELEVPSNPFTVTLPPHSISMVQVYLG